MKPVMAAAAICHTPKPSGISRTAKGEAMEARIEVFSMPSSTSWKLQLKLCMICTSVLQSRMMVPALTIYAQPRLHMEMKARLTEGTLYSGSSMMKKLLRFL